MIEVEKQFLPKPAQLKALLQTAKFLGEVVKKDVCYDYSDYRLFKKDVVFRRRNDLFELKIGKSAIAKEEIEIQKEIERYFNTDNLENFISDNLIIFTQFDTKRQKYKREDFNIDIDETSFGYKILEIEVMVEKEEQIEDAENKIIGLAKEFNFEMKKVPSKRREYLRLFKPEVYKELYKDK